MRNEKRNRLYRRKKCPVIFWGPTQWRGVVIDSPLFTDEKGRPKKVHTERLYEVTDQTPVKLFFRDDINRR